MGFNDSQKPHIGVHYDTLHTSWVHYVPYMTCSAERNEHAFFFGKGGESPFMRTGSDTVVRHENSIYISTAQNISLDFVA